MPSRAQSWRAAVACQASACRDAVQCDAACQLVPCRAVPRGTKPVVPTTNDARHPSTRSHIDIPGLSCQLGAPPPPPGRGRMEEARPVCPCARAPQRNHTQHPADPPPHDVHHPRRRPTPPHLHRYSRLAVAAGGLSAASGL